MNRLRQPVRLRAVQLTHLQPAPRETGSRPSQWPHAPSNSESCSRSIDTPTALQTSQSPCHTATETSEVAERVAGGGTPLMHHSRSPTRTNNLRKWQAFGLDTRNHVNVGDLEVLPRATGGATDHVRERGLPPAPSANTTAPSAAAGRDQRGASVAAFFSSSHHHRTSSAEPAANKAASEADVLRQHLSALSSRVEAAHEEQRCGPPRSSRREHRSSFGKQRPKKRDRRREDNAGDTAEDELDCSRRDDEAGVGTSASDSAARPKGRRSKTSGPDPGNSTGSKRGRGKGSGAQPKRTPRAAHPFEAAALSGRANAQPGPSRTLFCFQQRAAAAADEKPVSIPYEVLGDFEALFASLRAALEDPDRIQAPPLFVGLLTTVDGETNFSLSAASAGKVHFLPRVDPARAHEYIKQFVFRWNERVYVLPANLGFRLVERVVRELPGVELITFNAPALLLALFGFARRVVPTYCITDVRLMGWMVQLADGSQPTADFNALQKRSNPKGLASPLSSSGDPLQTLCNQVYYLAPLYRTLYGQLGAKGLLQAFLRQEKRVTLLIASMKRNGIVVDMAEVNRFKLSCTTQMDRMRARACAMVSSMEDFNIQSHDHCRQVIYEVLDLGRFLRPDQDANVQNVATTKGGKLSTAEETLKLLAEYHEFPRVLLAYRKAAKQLQTYVEGITSFVVPHPNPKRGGHADEDKNSANDHVAWDLSAKQSEDPFMDAGLAYITTKISATVDHAVQPLTSKATSDAAKESEVNVMTTPPQDGYFTLHPNFIQEGTETGRFSCVEPNLQSIPRSALALDAADDDGLKKEGLLFRRCFVAPPGFSLVSVDYQQIELRILAHLCADTALVKALTESTDIHHTIAEAVFRKQAISAEERSLAKRVVFGVLYGAGPLTLASQMNVSVERALHIASLLKLAFPHIDHFHQQVIAQCRAENSVRTMSGRVRYLPDINHSVMARRSYAERQAFNTVVQGSAADLMKASMLAVEREVLQKYPQSAFLLMQIHDEMVFYVEKNKLADLVPLIMRTMCRAMSLLVPLTVTAKFGPSLGNMQEWTVDHDLGIEEVA